MIEKFGLVRRVAHEKLMDHFGGCEACHHISNGTTIFCREAQGFYVTWRQVVVLLEGQQSEWLPS